MRQTNVPPLVVIGLDAGDPGFIEQWARMGHLPTIASLMARGCWGQTGGPELVSEHGVWVSLFSGLSRGQHGYHYFRQLKVGSYDLEKKSGVDVDAPPFWSYLAEQKKKVLVVDAPDSRLLPGLAGIQLLNWASHDSWAPELFVPMAEPASLLAEIQQSFGRKLSSLENHRSTLSEDRDIYRQLLSHVATKGALCRNLMARDPFDVAILVFAESHAANHQFWQYRPRPQDNAAQAEHELTHAIRDIYQAIDREIGLMLAQLPADANVIVVSSVGMEDDYPTTGLSDAFCRQFGYQVPAQDQGVSLNPMALARRLVPEPWRVALSRHLPRQQRERLLAQQFRSATNWRETTAFALPTHYTSFIRVNLRGREPQGIVSPGAEYAALLDRLESDLRQLVDGQTGQPAVTKIMKAVDLFGAEFDPALPDLFVEWQPGRFIERVTYPNGELVRRRPDYYRVSDHSSQGFLAAAGASIRQRGEMPAIDVLDLAPTFLRLMDQPVPDKFRGKTVANLLRL
ncbi:MAG: hypothetical protein FJ145_23935 [Deltaproteobacteria bacterium]|nr:hypothetical protein [Deltaproteobacteria bacterium]